MVETNTIKEPNFKNPESSEISGRVSELTQRLRMIEDRYGSVKKKSEFNEKNLISSEQEFTKELKLLIEEITELKKKVSEFEFNFEKIDEEINKAVKRDEFRVLEKYVQFWEPLNFVTTDDLKKNLK